MKVSHVIFECRVINHHPNFIPHVPPGLSDFCVNKANNIVALMHTGINK